MSCPSPKALQVLAGPAARQRLRARGLQPADVRLIPGAAGGPKGLILNPLDRWLFGNWLAACQAPLHLVGASIGAWRLAAAAMPDPDAALARLAEDYITQDYPHEPGQRPTAAVVSRAFAAGLAQHFPPQGASPLAHPNRHLHVLTSRGLGPLLRREGRWRTRLGYLGAFGANMAGRRWLGRWLQRVVWSDPRAPLPLRLDDYPSARAPLTRDNLAAAVLASCSIPFWLQAVHDIPGGPPGAHWDGGITDYHLHLPFATMPEGLVLYPHFQRQLVPGWLDKPFRRRHRATPALDNLVLLTPRPEWIATLPGGKLPDRQDFATFADDKPERIRRWRQAVAESARLADEAAALFAQSTIEADAL